MADEDYDLLAAILADPPPPPPPREQPTRPRSVQPQDPTPAQADPTPAEEALGHAAPRYFVIRSKDDTSLQVAMKKRVWATFPDLSAKLQAVYDRGDVILFFSVNGSGGFQGYAQMNSDIGKGSSHPTWSGVARRVLGEDFDIRWLKQGYLRFAQLKAFKNPLNDNMEIHRSANGTEIPEDIAKAIIDLYEPIGEPSLPVTLSPVRKVILAPPHPTRTAPEQHRRSRSRSPPPPLRRRSRSRSPARKHERSRSPPPRRRSRSPPPERRWSLVGNNDNGRRNDARVPYRR